MKGRAILLAAAVLFLAGQAGADVITDCFDGIIDSTGGVTVGPGQNTGWNEDGAGPWYEYPQPPPEQAWWNQWFYDHPPKPFPWYKKISYAFCIVGDGKVEIAINWSDLPYNNPDQPPMWPDDEPSIIREPVYNGGADGTISGDIIISEYNPEWISIDIRGYDVQVTGCIIHECIPEPGVLSLLAIGVLALVKRRRS